MEKHKTAKSSTYWGFDVKNLARSVRPQDDFYRYANGGWLAQNKIPADESRWGTFYILRHQTDRQLHAILSELLRRKKVKRGSYEQLARDVYLSATDFKRRDVRGIEPIEKWRKEIRALNSREALLKYIFKAQRDGLSALWSFYLDQDSKKSSRYLLHLYQSGLGLPDRDYYLIDKPEQKRVREAYGRHIVRMLKLAGIQREEAPAWQKTIMRIETELAQSSMRKEDARDVDKTYNKRTVLRLARELPAINWKTYFETLGAREVREVVVAQPAFLQVVEKMIGEIPLADWQKYLEWHLINDCAGMLTRKFAQANFDFYGRVLSGAKKMRPLWRRGLGSVNGAVGDALGKLYVGRYFTHSAKRRMDALVDDLFAAYRQRIKNLDWMSAATKRKALAKLARTNRKIGYPVVFDRFKKLTIRPDDYFGNMMRAHEYHHRKTMRRLKKPVDRREWFMTPQTVNAYHHFNLNEIVFPAAILQAPFFDQRADDAINYGGIGAVIGHEITHGFDDQGSKFDGAGNLKSWWTPKDRSHFKNKATILVRQYNAYEVAGGVHANGRLTLGENIADLGGCAIAYDAYLRRLQKTGRKDISGFSPEQRFFLGFAQAERELTRPEMLKIQALTDPHAAALLRVNGVLPNVGAFYEAFEVKKGDKLYKPPSKRARIW